jgi:hypothetical protein
MANQQISQLDFIEQLLDNRYIDTSQLLQEKRVSNGEKFHMERRIVSHQGITFLLFRYDTNKVKLFPYFSDISGLKQMCDYILFVEKEQNLYICLIELKLGTESANKQLQASESFASFMMDSAKRVGLPITNNMRVRKIRISEERSKKRPTKPQQLMLEENGIINYDSPDEFRIMEVLNIRER